MAQALQLLGAALVLIPFVWSQLGSLRIDSAASLAMNAAGSGILAVLALDDRQWGFLLLEAVWCAVAFWGLLRLAVRR